MATFYKQEAIRLAKEKATVRVREEDGRIVTRKAVGTFASRAGKASYWGVNFNKPLSDGCTGATINMLIQ